MASGWGRYKLGARSNRDQRTAFRDMAFEHLDERFRVSPAFRVRLENLPKFGESTGKG